MKVTQTLLLNWIYMLCFFGGFINTVSVVKYSYTISHFTGNTSKVAINIASGNIMEVLKLIFIMVSFMIGATISGYMVEGREFNLKRRYGYSFVALGLGLLILYSIARNSWIFFYYLPFMMGVQNGLFISYKGVVVRTSHVSGSVTDAGVYLGHCLRGKSDDRWKGFFCFYMVLAFLLGGFFGVESYVWLKSKVFILVGFGYIFIAGVYFFLRHRCRSVLCLEEERSPFK
ncbi:YoaK family protein [Fusobacterium sp.]|uniref:YoaK family protein n=1 Tax=Fusobacterium sp. TaxID=68766 RepID=UPI00396C4AD2